MDPVTVYLILAGAAEVGKSVFQYSAADQQKKAYELQNQNQMLQYQQKKLSTYSMLEKTTAEQAAQASVRGVALSSPSFNAIQRETYDIAARNFQNIETEHNISELNNKIERGNVSKTLFAQLFGNAADIAITGAKLKK